MKDTAHTNPARTTQTRPGALSLAALALTLAGGLLGNPAAYAGGTPPKLPVAQPQHIIWGNIRLGDSAVPMTAQAAPTTAPDTLAVQTPAPFTPPSPRIVWVRVRFYEDGEYQFLPNTEETDESDAPNYGGMSDDALDDDGSIVTLVPLVVND